MSNGASDGRSGGPILAVDDNPTNLMLLEAMLETAGYHVRLAASADAAIASIAEVRPRIILMDLQMPGIDGFELTRRLKADPTTREIVIIAVTALAMRGDEERARAAGCDDYISKPVNRLTLRAMIDRYLGPLAPGR